MVIKQCSNIRKYVVKYHYNIWCELCDEVDNKFDINKKYLIKLINTHMPFFSVFSYLSLPLRYSY